MHAGVHMPFSVQGRQILTDLPVILAGRMNNPDLALRAIGEASADIISLGRPARTGPEVADKIWEQRRNEIHPCISCPEGCVGRVSAFPGAEVSSASTRSVPRIRSGTAQMPVSRAPALAP